MKHVLLALFAAMTLGMSAQTYDIQLPAPQTTPVKKQQNLTLVDALRTRHSVRQYDANKKISNQQISNVCWAAVGIQRDKKHTTNPTARNAQEIRLFVFMESGVYEYVPQKNLLAFIIDGDYRKLMVSNADHTFEQNFVMDAYVHLLLVADLQRFENVDREHAYNMGLVDAGIACQNINLYCQAVGLATVPRATMDVNIIREICQLNEEQIPVLNNPIGYEAKK